MLNYKIDFNNLIFRSLPWHKRKPLQLVFLCSFVKPLSELLAIFNPWRDKIRLQTSVTSQVIVLEGYLRYIFSDNRIKITTYEDGLIAIGYLTEAITQYIGYDLDDMLALPFSGEAYDLFGADFIVHIPPQINIDSVTAEVEKFKRLTATYKIDQK